MEPSEVSYSEKQRFRQRWLWMLLLIFPVGSLWALCQEIILGSVFGGSAESIPVLFVLVVISAMFTLFMYTTGLDTEVVEEGLRIRFWPFHLSWMLFPFSSIQKAEAVTYRPLAEYGGWGIRYGRKGKAYNVSGNKGVLLTFKDQKNVLIGSKNHETLFLAINGHIQSSD